MPKKKDYEAQMPAPHGKLPEMDRFESSIGKPVKLTTLSGKTVVGVLVSYSTYSIFLQSSPSEFPVMYFKHGLASIER